MWCWVLSWNEDIFADVAVVFATGSDGVIEGVDGKVS